MTEEREMRMNEQFTKLAVDSKLWYENEMSKSVLEALRRLLIEVYPQDAHFIFELLQNAEDQGARTVEFVLTEGQLVFRHNGKAFNFADVSAISRVACSTKVNERDEDTRIGKFGIGFKSVYAYTNTPKIISGEWYFKVKNLVVPETLEDDEIQKIGVPPEFTTIFVLPFDHDRKSSVQAVNEITSELNGLSARSFVFLRHIEEVRVLMPTGGFVFKKPQPQDHVLIVSKHALTGQKISETKYLRFDDDVTMQVEDNGEIKHRNIPIGLAYRIADEENVSEDGEKRITQRIVSDPDASVYIHFPATGENSGLRYSIHASFAPTVSRSEIRDTPENRKLMGAIAVLQQKSLEIIKQSGLLGTDFFDVVPNSRDVIAEKYEVIRREVLKSFKNESLIPIRQGGFARASDVCRGGQIIQKIISDADLKIIKKDTNIAWAKNPSQKNSNAYKFFDDIGIEELNIETLVRECKERHDCAPLFDGKTNMELIQLFIYAKKEYAAWLHEEFKDGILKVPFIRLQTGELVAANCGRRLVRCCPDVKLIDAVAIHEDFDKYIKDGPDGEDLKVFFKKLNVDVYDEVSNLKYYMKNFWARNIENKEETIEENELYFSSMLDQLSANRICASECQGFPVICYDNKWKRLSQIFLDLPYIDSGLNLVSEALATVNRFQLSDVYGGILDERQLTTFLEHAKALGIMLKLQITRVDSVTGHVKANYLRDAPGNVMRATKEEKDFKIDILGKIIQKLNELQNDPIALKRIGHLIWQTLISATKEQLSAFYKPNRGAEGRCSDSSFVIQLKDNAWIPIENGLKKPRDVDRGCLMPDWEWPVGGYDNPALVAVDFGVSTADVRKAMAEQEKVCKELGFENLEEIRQFAELKSKLAQRGMHVRELKFNEGLLAEKDHNENKGSDKGKPQNVPRKDLEEEKFLSLGEDVKAQLNEIEKRQALGGTEDILGDRKAMVITIPQLLKMNLCIPEYQRPYKWEKDNVWDFMDDIKRMVIDKKTPENAWTNLPYRMGSIILHKEKSADGTCVYNIVDGQQRTLTFILLAFALGIDCDLLKKPEFYPALIQMSDSRRNLNNNLCHIMDYLKIHGSDCRAKFKEAFTKSLQVVAVCVTERDYAFQLFDSQNVKGRRLEPHDLLKAYHLRELDFAGEKEDCIKDLVEEWERFDVQDLSYLFDKLLYPILKWSEKERCYGFTTKDLKAFKGVPQRRKNYGYVKRAFAAVGNYRIGTDFAPGKEFFKMVSYYQDLLKRVREKAESCPVVKDILKNGSNNAYNNAYTKALFESVLMAYFDRFGLDLPREEVDAAIKTLCKWVYSARLDLKYFSPKTPNKYALGVIDGSSNYTNRTAMFFAIRNAVFHTDIAKMAVKMSNSAKENQKTEARKSLWDLVNAL